MVTGVERGGMYIEGSGRTYNHRGRWTRVKSKRTKQVAHCLETLSVVV